MIRQLAMMILDAQARREASFDGSQYTMSIRQAARRACRKQPALADVVVVLVMLDWIEAQKWAQSVLADQDDCSF